MDANQDQSRGLESVLVQTVSDSGVLGGKAYRNQHMLVYARPENAGDHVSGGNSSNERLTVGRIEDDYDLKAVGELEPEDRILVETEDFRDLLNPEQRERLYFNLEGLNQIDEESSLNRSNSGIVDPYTNLQVDTELWLAINDESYIQAKDQLFLEVNGRTVPRFQYELLAASAKKGLIDQEVLDRKLPEGTLVESDVAEAADYISCNVRLVLGVYSPSPVANNALETHTATEADSANSYKAEQEIFQGYLLGRTVSPKHLDVFVGLGLVMDSKYPFMDMYEEGSCYN